MQASPDTLGLLVQKDTKEHFKMESYYIYFVKLDIPREHLAGLFGRIKVSPSQFLVQKWPHIERRKVFYNPM